MQTDTIPTEPETVQSPADGPDGLPASAGYLSAVEVHDHLPPQNAFWSGGTSVVCGDCLHEMPKMPAQSVDAIISDLPYGTTACKWDALIPFAPLWTEWKRLLKPNGAIVLTASQPFTSLLVVSNLSAFKYEVIWEKDKPSDFALAARRTMKYHESVLVFCSGRETYNPQMTMGEPNHSVGKGVRKKVNESGANTATVTNKLDGWKHPKSVMRFNREPSPVHPTQKPVELMRYLVRTYTNPGDVVLDPCCGSGTTLLAAKIEGRRYIGIEKEKHYAEITKTRLQDDAATELHLPFVRHA